MERRLKQHTAMEEFSIERSRVAPLQYQTLATSTNSEMARLDVATALYVSCTKIFQQL
jgi:hypothetical protein